MSRQAAVDAPVLGPVQRASDGQRPRSRRTSLALPHRCPGEGIVVIV